MRPLVRLRRSRPAAAGRPAARAVRRSDPLDFEPVKADLVVVRKSARSLQLMRAGRVVKSYRVALGREPDRPQASGGRRPHARRRLYPRLAQSEQRFLPLDPRLLPARGRRRARAALGRLAGRPDHAARPAQRRVGRADRPSPTSTGPTAASRSPTRRSTRSGRGSRTAPRSSSIPDAGRRGMQPACGRELPRAAPMSFTSKAMMNLQVLFVV